MKLFFQPMLWAKKCFKLWTQNELVNGIIQKNTNLICFFGTEKRLSIIQYSTYMREFSPLDFYIFCTILPHFSVLHVEHKLLVKFFFPEVFFKWIMLFVLWKLGWFLFRKNFQIDNMMDLFFPFGLNSHLSHKSR